MDRQTACALVEAGYMPLDAYVARYAGQLRHEAAEAACRIDAPTRFRNENDALAREAYSVRIDRAWAEATPRWH
jgi:hypothetical protein